MSKKMKTVSINLYSFNELSNEAKEKAIFEHADFLQSIGQEVENEAGELVTEYADEIDRAEVIDSIECNEYLFFADGDMAHCVTYTGKHPRTGETEFKFHGQTITI